MKTRILHTKIYDDGYVSSLKPLEKLFFIYLLTNENVNIIHCYELPERKALFQTGLDKKTIDKAKAKFHKDGKILFNGDFVYLPNATKYEKYTGVKNEGAKETAKKQLPESVKKWLEALQDRGIDTGMDTPISTQENPEVEDTGMDRGIDTPSIPPINHKSEIINKNEGGVGETFLKVWNDAMGTNFKSFKAFEKNLEYWQTVYTIEEIMQAVAVVPTHQFWKDKMTPDMFLRKRNPSGENVDRIGEMLNYKPSKNFEGEKKDKYKNL